MRKDEHNQAPFQDSESTVYNRNVTQNANCRLLTDFWGPVSNFGIPVAAVMDTQKDAEMYVGTVQLSYKPGSVGLFRIQ